MLAIHFRSVFLSTSLDPRLDHRCRFDAMMDKHKSTATET